MLKVEKVGELKQHERSADLRSAEILVQLGEKGQLTDLLCVSTVLRALRTWKLARDLEEGTRRKRETGLDGDERPKAVLLSRCLPLEAESTSATWERSVAGPAKPECHFSKYRLG